MYYIIIYLRYYLQLFHAKCLRDKFLYRKSLLNGPSKNRIFWDESEQTGSQQTFTCSNSTIETLEKGVKHVQSYQ